jgi:deazaflavin-dependent oxidoreductase (nitroreductase family)
MEDTMTTVESEMETKARQGFKYFNRFMLLMWRLGLGSWVNAWPEVGGRIMVITHIGRKSGHKRRSPVNYALIDGELYCTAGFGKISDWYRNLMVHPNVEVWLPEGWWDGTTEEVTDPGARLLLLRQVLINSGVVAPLMGVRPREMSDEALDAVTRDYRLIHIHRTAPCTGPGGPGDLAWVWPLSTHVLLALLLLRRKRK